MQVVGGTDLTARLELNPAQLTSPTISVVSAARVSFSLSGGGACLARSLTGLFGSRGPVSVSGGSGSSATYRLGGGGQGGALLLFSLNVSRSGLTRTDETFSTTLLCVSADIEEDSMTRTVKNGTEETRKRSCRWAEPQSQRSADCRRPRLGTPLKTAVLQRGGMRVP